MITTKDFEDGVKNCKDLGEVLDSLEIDSTLGQMIAPEGMFLFPSMDGVGGDVMLISMEMYKLHYLFKNILENIDDGYFPVEACNNMQDLVTSLNQPNITKEDLTNVTQFTLSLDNFKKFQYVVTALYENGTITEWMFPQNVVDEVIELVEDDSTTEDKLHMMRYISVWGKDTKAFDHMCSIVSFLEKHTTEVFAGGNPLSGKHYVMNIVIGTSVEFRKLMTSVHKVVGFTSTGMLEPILEDLISADTDPDDVVTIDLTPKGAGTLANLFQRYEEIIQ